MGVQVKIPSGWMMVYSTPRSEKHEVSNLGQNNIQQYGNFIQKELT